MRLRARSTVEKARFDLEAAVREAEAYSTGVLAADALAVESALASFQAGKSPFLSVLEAHNTLYRDRWQHAELLFHVLWHSASLDAMGVVMD
jgi:outer membrane protein TolC